MKITLFGATGTIGKRVLREALSRGHDVTTPARDVLDAASVAKAAAGADAVVSAFGPRQGDPRQVVAAARALVDGAKRAGVKRLIVVGGAGSLKVEPGIDLVDSPRFPATWREIALAHRDSLSALRQAELDWTFFAPAALIAPGERTGKYRVGADALIADANGESRISTEDYAAALLDELEKPRFARQVMTAAY